MSRMANAFFLFRLVNHAVVSNLIMQDRERGKRAMPLKTGKKIDCHDTERRSSGCFALW